MRIWTCAKSPALSSRGLKEARDILPTLTLAGRARAKTRIIRVLFADAFYWIALLNPKDENYQRVKALNRTLTQTRLVTTDEVLTEFLNFYDRINLVLFE